MTNYSVFDGQMTAPENGVVFGFNPCFLTFSGVTSVDTILLDFSDCSEYGGGEVLGRMKVHLLNGYAHVDISTYLRAEFGGRAKGADIFRTSSRVAVQIGDGESLEEELEYTVVYGAMLPGEVFNASRSVRLWSAYPQVVSFFHGSQYNEDVEIYLQKDRNEPQQWQLPQSDFYDAMISNYDNQAEEEPMQESGQIIIYPSSATTLTTFTMQFDGSFTAIEGETIININVDNRPQCDDHIFLRWLDKWGFWQYWLCKVGEVQMTDTVVGSALTFLTGTTYPYYATRNIGKSLVKQVTACATNLTDEEWQMLSTIKGSINVCAFDTASQSWVPVNVAAGASVWKMGNQASHRQDFPMKIVFPTIQTQRL
jgi:hypothetical protein